IPVLSAHLVQSCRHLDLIPDLSCFLVNGTATTEIYTLSLHDALPICIAGTDVTHEIALKLGLEEARGYLVIDVVMGGPADKAGRSEEHTSELQSREKLVCRLLLEKKNNRDDELNITVARLFEGDYSNT